MSSIYANIKCAKDEFDFIKSLGPTKKRIYGIRQVDDLFLMIAYSHDDPGSYRLALNYKRTILRDGGVYKGGLILEEQEHLKTEYKVSHHKFAGTIITVDQQKKRNKNFL